MNEIIFSQEIKYGLTTFILKPKQSNYFYLNQVLNQQHHVSWLITVPVMKYFVNQLLPIPWNGDLSILP